MDILKQWREKLVDNQSTHGMTTITIIATLMLSAGVNLITGIANAGLYCVQMILMLCGSVFFIGSGIAFMLIVSDADSIKAEIIRRSRAIGDNPKKLKEFTETKVNNAKRKLTIKLMVGTALFLVAVFMTCYSDYLKKDNNILSNGQPETGNQRQAPVLRAPAQN